MLADSSIHGDSIGRSRVSFKRASGLSHWMVRRRGSEVLAACGSALHSSK